MMEKLMTMLVGILLALAGWSLSRTFELSTGQAELEDNIDGSKSIKKLIIQSDG